MNDGLRLPPVYLASGSPRRREILGWIGIEYEPLEVLVDENPLDGEAAPNLAVRLARLKAIAGRAQAADATRPVLAADTVVSLDGRIFGKPQGRAQGLATLGALRGRTHQVHTAVAVALGESVRVRLSRSDVTFRDLTAGELEAYWDTGEPADKAGGYAIQGIAARFVTRLEGSYSGVMGLPAYETAELLRELCA